MLEILVVVLTVFCFNNFLNLKLLNAKLLLLNTQLYKLLKTIETDKLLDKCESTTNVIPFNRKDC